MVGGKVPHLKQKKNTEINNTKTCFDKTFSQLLPDESHSRSTLAKRLEFDNYSYGNIRHPEHYRYNKPTFLNWEGGGQLLNKRLHWSYLIKSV